MEKCIIGWVSESRYSFWNPAYQLCKFFFKFLFFFGRTLQLEASSSRLDPLQWKCVAVTTGPQGISGPASSSLWNLIPTATLWDRFYYHKCVNMKSENELKGLAQGLAASVWTGKLENLYLTLCFKRPYSSSTRHSTSVFMSPWNRGIHLKERWTRKA